MINRIIQLLSLYRCDTPVCAVLFYTMTAWNDRVLEELMPNRIESIMWVAILLRFKMTPLFLLMIMDLIMRGVVVINEPLVIYHEMSLRLCDACLDHPFSF